MTRVSAQARDPNRVSVHVEGAFAFGMPAHDAVDLGIRAGASIDERLAAAALRADAVYRAKQRALGLLAHRPRAVDEVRRRLDRAGFDEDVSEAVVTRLVELGHLDDHSFAVAYARSRAESKGYGARRILAELRRRGVADGTARRAVESVDADRDAFADALAASDRYWDRLRREPDARRRRNRLYGFLARRGHGADVIRAVLDTLESRQP